MPTPLNATRGAGSSLVLAREWGVPDLESNLVEAIEASYEPTWNAPRGEFTWGLGLDEPHPRGQYNAFLAAAEASGAGMWTRLSGAPLAKCPQVVGVDFPRVAMRRAEWIDGCLHLDMRVLDRDPSVKTSFRVEGTEPRIWDVQAPDGTRVESTAAATLLRVPMVDCRIELSPGSY